MLHVTLFLLGYKESYYFGNHVSLMSTINNLHFATFGTVVDICRYINILEGEAKQSKVKSIMKWWSKVHLNLQVESSRLKWLR